MLITKGAPEAVLARCPALPENAQTTLDKLFADGERIIAVATRDLPAGTSAITTQDERQLTLAGFLTFADRPKPDAGAAVAQLSRLGVDVKIITGDNGVVAAKVCREIGIEVAGVFYRAHDARPAVPGAQPPSSGAQPATDLRTVRWLHRRAAPFTVKVLTGPGRWFLRPGSPAK